MIKIFGIVIITKNHLQELLDNEYEKAYDAGLKIGEEAGYDSYSA